MIDAYSMPIVGHYRPAKIISYRTLVKAIFQMVNERIPQLGQRGRAIHRRSTGRSATRRHYFTFANDNICIADFMI